MKGQINFEFIISFSIFIIVISYVTISAVANLPDLHRESVSNAAKARLFQVSELLLFDSRIGLSTGEAYVLDVSRVNAMKDECATYQRFRDRFSLDAPVDMRVLIKNDAGIVLDCRPDIISASRSEFSLRRFGILNGEIVEIDMGVFA